jgi:diguanylate cyclase (GGDEF)-like protein
VAAAAESVRQGGQGFALLVVDLDRFRHINDSLGQDVGDRVLMDVAQRIQGCLRQDDLLARLSGDQFALLVRPADAAAAEATARRVLNVVAQPSNLDGAQFTLTCSIGVALSPSHGWIVDDLVRHAEAAMRKVKEGGRANFRLHQARAEVDRRSHMRLDHAMRQALVSGRFRLHYQPQVNLVDGRIVGAEALLRWRDPELGEVPPSHFIRWPRTAASSWPSATGCSARPCARRRCGCSVGTMCRWPSTCRPCSSSRPTSWTAWPACWPSADCRRTCWNWS